MSFDANQNLPTPAPLTVCSGFDPLTSHDACLIEKGADPRRKGTKLDYTGWFPLWCCEIVGRVGNSLQDVPYDCPRRTKGPRSYSTYIHDFAIRPSSRSARFYKLICQINFYDFHDLINSRDDFRISGSRTKNIWLYSRLITSRSLVRTRMRVWQRDSRLKLARCGGVSGSVPRRCDYQRDLGSRMLRGPLHCKLELPTLELLPFFATRYITCHPCSHRSVLLSRRLDHHHTLRLLRIIHVKSYTHCIVAFFPITSIPCSAHRSGTLDLFRHLL